MHITASSFGLSEAVLWGFSAFWATADAAQPTEDGKADSRLAAGLLAMIIGESPACLKMRGNRRW